MGTASEATRQALCMFEGMKENSLRCDELVYNTLMEGTEPLKMMIMRCVSRWLPAGLST